MANYVSNFNVLGENIVIRDPQAVKYLSNITELKNYNSQIGNIIYVDNYNGNDGANGLYVIKNTGINDGGRGILLNNGLYAIFINDEISTKNYGITDDLDCSEKLTSLLNNNHNIIFENQKYIINNNVYVTNPYINIVFKNSTIDLNANIIIDKDTSEYSPVLNLNNLPVSSTSLPTLGLELNRPYIIRSTETYFRTWKKQDIVYTVATSGSSTIINEALNFSYGDCYVVKPDFTTLNWKGAVKINGNGCLKFYHLINSTIEGLSINSTNDALNLYSCLNVLINNCNVTSINNTSGTQYGIGIYNSNDISINNCICYANRHAITFGGAYICNRCSVLNSSCGSATLTGFDTHASANNIVIQNCKLYGVTIGGNRIKLTNNIIYGQLYFANLWGANVKVTNNSLYLDKTYEYFLNIAITDNLTEGGVFEYSNNYHYMGSYSVDFAGRIAGANANNTSIVFTNNTFIGTINRYLFGTNLTGLKSVNYSFNYANNQNVNIGAGITKYYVPPTQ